MVLKLAFLGNNLRSFPKNCRCLRRIIGLSRRKAHFGFFLTKNNKRLGLPATDQESRLVVLFGGGDIEPIPTHTRHDSSPTVSRLQPASGRLGRQQIVPAIHHVPGLPAQGLQVRPVLSRQSLTLLPKNGFPLRFIWLREHIDPSVLPGFAGL